MSVHQKTLRRPSKIVFLIWLKTATLCYVSSTKPRSKGSGVVSGLTEPASSRFYPSSSRRLMMSPDCPCARPDCPDCPDCRRASDNKLPRVWHRLPNTQIALRHRTTPSGSLQLTKIQLLWSSKSFHQLVNALHALLCFKCFMALRSIWGRIPIKSVAARIWGWALRWDYALWIKSGSVYITAL